MLGAREESAHLLGHRAQHGPCGHEPPLLCRRMGMAAYVPWPLLRILWTHGQHVSRHTPLTNGFEGPPPCSKTITRHTAKAGEGKKARGSRGGVAATQADTISNSIVEKQLQ